MGDRFLSSARTGKNCALSMRFPDHNPVLAKNRAPMGPEILSSTGAGVCRKPPQAFPDSSSVLDKFQSAILVRIPNSVTRKCSYRPRKPKNSMTRHTKWKTGFCTPPVLGSAALFAVQHQRCVKFRVLRAQEFYTPLALNGKKGSSSPLEVCRINLPQKSL